MPRLGGPGAAAGGMAMGQFVEALKSIAEGIRRRTLPYPGSDPARWATIEERLVELASEAGGEKAAELSSALTRWIWDRGDKGSGAICGRVFAALADAGVFAKSGRSTDLLERVGMHPDAVGDLLGSPEFLDQLMESVPIGAEHGVGWWLPVAKAGASLDGAGRNSVDDALERGALARIVEAGHGAAWALCCLAAGHGPRFRAAVAVGADISGASPELVGQALLMALKIAQFQEDRLIPGGGGLSLEEDKEIHRAAAPDRAAWGKAKAALWEQAAALGMPLAASSCFEGMESGSPFQSRFGSASGEDVLRVEAGRGGAMSGPALAYWVGLELGGGVRKDLWGKEGPLAWAFAHGMDPKEWNMDVLDPLVSKMGTGSRVAKVLGVLAEAGCRLDERPWRLARAKVGDPKAALLALVRMGADAEAAVDGTPLAVALLSQATSRTPGQLEALLAASEAAAPGGALRAASSTMADGSSALHWAARGPCDKSVKILIDAGVDPMIRDAKGATAGHWAAKRYSKQWAPKMVPVITALTWGGFDWAALDHSGKSAVAALAARGPLEPVESIFASAPAAFEAKAGKAASAVERLQARPAEGVALVIAETVVLGVAAGEAEAAKPRKRSGL